MGNLVSATPIVEADGAITFMASNGATTTHVSMRCKTIVPLRWPPCSANNAQLLHNALKRNDEVSRSEPQAA